MKIKSLLSLAMAALLATACSNEEELTYTATSGVLKATVEGNNADTRVGFDKDGKFFWSTRDTLGVTTTRLAGNFIVFTLTEGSGESSGTFEATFAGEIGKYAVYPYSEKHSVSETTLTYNLPASYTYSQVDANYFIDPKGTGKSFNTAMWGKIVNNSVVLKHLGGVFCIKINQMPVGSGKLTFTTDKKITGDFTADLSQESPVLAVQSESTTATTDNTVSIEFSGAQKDQPGVFYVPVPTGTYNVSVQVTDGNNNNVLDCKAGEYTINRCTAQKLTIQKGSITATSEELVENINAVADNLQTNEIVTVTGEVSGTSNEVTLGAEVEGTKSLALENVADNASLTIDGTAANQLEDFTLSIPNTTSTGEALLDVTINMPNTSVTLTGNAGEAKYGDVTAATADNTLIIGSKVSVAKVTVKKGNIRVNAGATLTAIERATENTQKVIIYQEAGANIPSNLGEGFEVRDAAVADMKKVFAEGGTYTLQQDMNIVGIQMEVPADKEVILDLNGKKLKAANDANILVKGHFILQDNAGSGMIEATKDYEKNVYDTGIITIFGEKALMTMQGGYIKAVRTDVANQGQYGIMVDQGGDFIMEGGKIEAGWFAISGNGNNKTLNSIIDIKGGELISTADYTIYLPHAGTTNISGGTIKGASGAIGMRSGTLNISGNAQLIGEGTGDTGQWKDGTGSMEYAVINIGNGSQNTYGNCTVNVNGGTFTAIGKTVDIAKRETDAKHTITVNVKGGTFSDPSALAFLNENANVTVVLNKNYNTPTGAGITLNQKATTTVDLNGFDITNNKEFNDNGDISTYGFNISKGELTIKNSNTKKVGKVSCVTDESCAADGYRFAIYAHGTSTVNIEGGSFYNKQTKNTQIDLVSVYDSAKVYISGGTFESGCYGTPDNNQKGRYWVLNKKNQQKETCVISVSGGTFINFNPGNPNMDDDPSYLAEGYAAYRDNQIDTEAYGAPADGRKEYVVKAIQ